MRCFNKPVLSAAFGAKCISTTIPNPKKIAVVTQYPKDTIDFSFLPAEYSIRFVELDRIQSKDEFINAVKGIDHDSVVINLIDNCEETVDAEVERYLSSAEAQALDDIDRAEQSNIKWEKERIPEPFQETQKTYYKVCGLTAIEWYNRLNLAYTGASAFNFATKKTDFKMKGVPTPKHVVVRNRNLAEWQVQFRHGAQASKLSGINTRKKGHNSVFPLKFPVIVKPLKDYGGSTFIQEKMKCESMKELQERVANFPVPDMLIEEFIIGEEYEALIYEKSRPDLSMSVTLHDTIRQRDEHIKLLVDKICKQKDLTPIQKDELHGTLLQKHREIVAGTTRCFHERATETDSTVSNPNQVVLPSNDSFQHEELKWRALSSACEKANSGKTNNHFMLKYRTVPQKLFSRNSDGSSADIKRCVVSNKTEKITTLDHLLELQKDEKGIRDAYLNLAIKKAAKKAWKTLKHDGYFRYDFRVEQASRKPPINEAATTKLFDRYDGNMSKIPAKEFRKLFPEYKFNVYIVDANPYCSVFGLLRIPTDADKLIAYTPHLSHQEFADDIIRAGINRELKRRVAQCRQEINKSVRKQLETLADRKH